MSLRLRGVEPAAIESLEKKTRKGKKDENEGEEADGHNKEETKEGEGAIVEEEPKERETDEQEKEEKEEEKGKEDEKSAEPENQPPILTMNSLNAMEMETANQVNQDHPDHSDKDALESLVSLSVPILELKMDNLDIDQHHVPQISITIQRETDSPPGQDKALLDEIAHEKSTMVNGIREGAPDSNRKEKEKEKEREVFEFTPRSGRGRTKGRPPRMHTPLKDPLKEDEEKEKDYQQVNIVEEPPPVVSVNGEPYILDEERLLNLNNLLIEKTEGFNVEMLQWVHSNVYRLIFQHRNNPDKTHLLNALQDEIVALEKFL